MHAAQHKSTYILFLFFVIIVTTHFAHTTFRDGGTQKYLIIPLHRLQHKLLLSFAFI